MRAGKLSAHHETFNLLSMALLSEVFCSFPQYSFFLSDLAQLAMGLYVAVLAAAIRRAQLRPGAETLKPLLEQAISVWLEHAGNWKGTVLKALEEVKFGRELREPIAGVQEEDFYR